MYIIRGRMETAMKCDKCNGEWTPPPGKSLTVCPFCGADLPADPAGADPGNVVAVIVRKYGDGILLEPQRLSEIIGELIPGELVTRKRLNLAIREKVPQKLHGLKQKDAHERSRAMKAEASGLYEVYGMREEMTYEIVNYFAVALGYGALAAAPYQAHPKPPASAVPAGGPNVVMDDVVGIEMVFVRGGTFMMGDTGGNGYDNEKPVHSVTLSDFYIGKYPVTQRQWFEVMESSPSYFTGDDLPVERVSWNDAYRFIQKLNAKTGNKYRLPTEAEWEYAARGGADSRGYIYSGSNDINDVAWYRDHSGYKTHNVGTKAPNELGIYNMSGNVWEWVNDWYDREYREIPDTDPPGPSTGSYRVSRGGSWGNAAGGCRVSHRSYCYPDDRRGILGFRLAVSP
jgi:formylglycine-generating enzyme required for sulfatase activity